MSTKPKHDPRSIAIDARRVLDAARTDLTNADFKKRVGKHELDTFQTNIEALEAGDGARSARLSSQVAAGAHAASARAAVHSMLIDLRDDAKITLSGEPLLHAFGVGANASPASTSELRHLGDSVLAAAHAHPTEAAKIGLDTKGIHKLEDLLHALDGTDLAHVHAITGRHATSVETDSLAHLVSAEAAHLRLVARRVFRGEEATLARYDRTLPRHEIKPRTAVASPPAAPAKA